MSSLPACPAPAASRCCLALLLRCLLLPPATWLKVTIIAGIAGTSGNVDGVLGTNKLNGPLYLTLDSAESLVYFTQYYHTVRLGLRTQLRRLAGAGL